MRDSVALLEDIRFGGPVWSRSVETSKEEEEESILEATPLKVCTGEVEADVVNAKRLGGIRGGIEGQGEVQGVGS